MAKYILSFMNDLSRDTEMFLPKFDLLGIFLRKLNRLHMYVTISVSH